MVVVGFPLKKDAFVMCGYVWCNANTTTPISASRTIATGPSPRTTISAAAVVAVAISFLLLADLIGD